MDKILLRDIRLQMKVGTTRQERGQPQPCRADLTLWRPLEKAGDGRLDKTVDYSAVYSRVEKLCESRDLYSAGGSGSVDVQRGAEELSGQEGQGSNREDQSLQRKAGFRRSPGGAPALLAVLSSDPSSKGSFA